MLVLFDIDGTLLLTDGAGLHSMGQAGHALRGKPFELDAIDFAGRLDALIWNDIALANGIDDPDAQHEAFRVAYTEALRRRLREQPTTRALAGVELLLARLHATPGITLGLLTGNYPETGRLKLEAAGLDPDMFVVSSWGSDGAHRRELPPVAMTRYETHFGQPITAREVLIIGDTPHDIDCARANGCPVIAVGTGPQHSIETLRALDPDLAVDDLSDTDAIVDWLLAAVGGVT